MDSHEFNLTNMPEYILVKLINTDNQKSQNLKNLGENLLPIFPMKKTYLMKISSMKTITVTRLQFPLTLAFAFTVFKAQGQTFSKLIVDLTKPENGPLPINYAYTAIGRATNYNSILILRPFKQSCIKSKPCKSLLNELKRFQQLEKETISNLVKTYPYLLQ
jgi:hypothetical protein